MARSALLELLSGILEMEDTNDDRYNRQDF